MLSDIHKATEEIATVNNTKIEKIRLHLIEVGSVVRRGGFHQQLIKICFVLVILTLSCKTLGFDVLVKVTSLPLWPRRMHKVKDRER